MDIIDDQGNLRRNCSQKLLRIYGEFDDERPKRVTERLFNLKSLSHLGQKEKYAIECLVKLIHTAKNQDINLYDNIGTLGSNANNAVLSLGLQNNSDLPFPIYDIPETSTHRGFLANVPAMQKVCKNAMAWLWQILKHSPQDLISTINALDEFKVSRPTLMRYLKDRLIHSYRSPKAPKNATHIFSKAEIGIHWPHRI